MYAIIQTGGKQFKVEKGSRLQIQKLEQEVGADVELGEVLLLNGDGGAKVGTPFVSGAKVLAKIVRQFRAPKVLIFKKRSKKGYRKKQGHRQSLTEIEIKDIVG